MRIYILIIFLSSISFGNSLCLKNYHEKDLKTRFQETLASRSNSYFPLVLGDFIKLELKGLTELYDEQISHLKISNSSTGLSSELSLFKTQTTSIEKEIENLDRKLSPSVIKKLITTNKQREKNLNAGVEKLLVCKKGFETCSASLETAVNDSGEGLKQLEILIDNLSKKYEEMEELHRYIEENKQSFGHSTTTALQIFETELSKIQSIILNTKTALESQSKILTVAYLRLAEDVPEIEFKLRNLVAKGAPEGIIKKVLSDKMKDPTEGLFSIINASNNKTESARTFYNVITNMPVDSIPAEKMPELIELLIPKFNELIFASYHGRFASETLSISYNSTSSKIYSPDFRLLALYYFIYRISPSKSKTKNNDVISAFTKLLHETINAANFYLPDRNLGHRKEAHELLINAINTGMAKFINQGLSKTQ